MPQCTAEDLQKKTHLLKIPQHLASKQAKKHTVSITTMLPYSIVLIFITILTTGSLFSQSSPSPLNSFLQSLPQQFQLLLNWNQSTSPCSWTGITCTPTGTIQSLNLSSLGLAGSLSASVPHLCSLPGLVSLDLSVNSFSGPIPPQLGNCSKLQSILLEANLLSDHIPPELFLSGRLVELNLGRNALTGSIPSDVRFSPLLEYAGFYSNSLTGEIPKELPLLPRLKYLYVSDNNLTGTMQEFPSNCVISELYVHMNMLSGELPASLFNCHNLTVFFASDNEFGGALPDLFQKLPRLGRFYLEYNRLEGEIPRSLERLENLNELVLAENRFNGTIPGQIGRCQSLTLLSLWGNYLTGPVPASVGDLSSLSVLLLSQNQLSGRLPPELGNCSLLTEIELQGNLITGPLPREIYKLRNLEKLLLFKNHVEGTLSSEIANLSNLVQLQLYNNSLTGQIPEEIAQLKRLRHISLAFNNLTGQIPWALGKNTVGGLISLDLTGNNLHGSIPPYLCAGNNLTVLVIGRNRFNGSFPAEISSCHTLWRVILANNHLHGNIPENLSMNPAISYLDLSNNLFEGRIPAILGSWHNLSMLDLSNNSLVGPIPPEFGSLENLEKLRISSNRLTGSIPHELGKCTKLLKLDLSWNSLAGKIPVEIVRLEKLQDLVLSGNKLTGEIPDSLTPSQSLLELQLGENMLEGRIPFSLGSLQYIYLALNLSNNRLTGEIPASFSNLDKLQVLDLSNNSLSGQIPSGLNSMISLSFVNVSFNKLSGNLPANWIKLADQFPGSFLGNPNLIVHHEAVEQHRRSKGRWTILAAVVAYILSLVAGGLCAAKYFANAKARRLSAPSRTSTRGFDSNGGLPEDLTYEDILRVTEDLSDKYVIGKGRHGTVYKTQFGKGKCWAVKKLDLMESSFFLEAKIMGVVRHRNLVKMAGYCCRDGFGMIIYEYMAGGTLFDVLHQKKPQLPLDWEVRLRIALGIAQGLSYLHHDCVPQIIHRDVKSNNVLLDTEYEPKVGDFGMAKMVESPDDSSTMSSIVGTLGYIAPENGYSTRLTEKSDIYSYGVVLLELLSRKMPVDPSFDDGVDIVTWMRARLNTGDWEIIFGSLDEEITYWTEDDREKSLELLELAMSCTQTSCDARPSMREVVGTLIKLK